MDRRNFLQSGMFMGTAMLGIARAMATDATPRDVPGTTGDVMNAAPEICIMHVDEVVAETENPTSYDHYHTLALPLETLIAPPAAGFKIRTSPLDADSLDREVFEEFLRQTRLPRALESHSHEVTFTREQLIQIANGERRVHVKVVSPKGNLAHDLFFTASPSSMIKIKRGRAAKGMK